MVFDPKFAILVGNAVAESYIPGLHAKAADYTAPDGFRIHDVIIVNDDASKILPLGQDPVSFGYTAQHIANPKLGLIVLRGTSDVDEWIEDAKCLRRSWLPEGRGGTPIGEVADGFLDLMDSVEYHLPPEVESVAIVGHSLGSALAVLFAMQLMSPGRSVRPNAVYLFACPNVGNKQFASIYNSVLGDRTFRIVIPQDIVPHLPPTILGYANVGQNITLHPPAGTKANLMVYHSMTTYLAALAE